MRRPWRMWLAILARFSHTSIDKYMQCIAWACCWRIEKQRWVKEDVDKVKDVVKYIRATNILRWSFSFTCPIWNWNFMDLWDLPPTALWLINSSRFDMLYNKQLYILIGPPMWISWVGKLMIKEEPSLRCKKWRQMWTTTTFGLFLIITATCQKWYYKHWEYLMSQSRQWVRFG